MGSEVGEFMFLWLFGFLVLMLGGIRISPNLIGAHGSLCSCAKTWWLDLGYCVAELQDSVYNHFSKITQSLEIMFQHRVECPGAGLFFDSLHCKGGACSQLLQTDMLFHQGGCGASQLDQTVAS